MTFGLPPRAGGGRSAAPVRRGLRRGAAAARMAERGVPHGGRPAAGGNVQPTRPFAWVRVPHGCWHSTLHSRAQRKRPPSAHGCEWLRCGCGSEHTHRTAQHAARHTVRRGTHRVLPGYSRGTSRTPCGHLELTVALCLPHCCRSRTSTGTASRSCARSCRWASAVLCAVPRSTLPSKCHGAWCNTRMA